MQSSIEKFSVMQRGQLIIDPQCYTVTIQGKILYLQAKEMRMLCLLAEHTGWVFTKEQIYEFVYNTNQGIMDDVNIDNSIYCLVYSLRKKIEKDPCHPIYIQTIYGVGYGFNTPEE